MKKLILLLLILVAAWWMWHCVYTHNGPIEADVTERANAALAESKFASLIASDEVAVDVDGRDVILSGVVNNVAEKANLLKTARDTYGVARVFDKLEIAQVPTAPVIVPEPVAEIVPKAIPAKTCFAEIPAWMNEQKISFASAKAIINSESYDILNEMAKKLEDCPGVKISVEGHTDSDGSESLNQKLSANRAAAVVTYLQGKGVDQTITSAGYGESQPVASNDTPEGKAQNRRVVFTITENN